MCHHCKAVMQCWLFTSQELRLAIAMLDTAAALHCFCMSGWLPHPERCCIRFKSFAVSQLETPAGCQTYSCSLCQANDSPRYVIEKFMACLATQKVVVAGSTHQGVIVGGVSVEACFRHWRRPTRPGVAAWARSQSHPCILVAHRKHVAGSN